MYDIHVCNFYRESITWCWLLLRNFPEFQLGHEFSPACKRKKKWRTEKGSLKATEEITKFGPEVILLYTSKEIAQLLLQQVR